MEYKVPQLSVIIPVYNREKTVAKSIRSVGNLSPIDCEIILVDDGSNDASVEVSRKTLELMGVPYKIVDCEVNKGVSSARNKGIKIARGDWIIFLDSDDEYLKGSGAVLSEQLGSQNDYIAFSYIVNGMVAPKLPINEDPFFYFLKKKYFNTNTIVCRNYVFSDLRFREGFKVGEDTDLWARVLFFFKGRYVDKPIAQYNLQHKFYTPDRHPFYDVTLPELNISDAKKGRLRQDYLKYLFRQKSVLRKVSISEVLSSRDLQAHIFWILGPRGYKLLWMLKRWVKS